MYPIKMPRSGRVVSAVLGAFFLVLGIGILATSGGGGWKPVLGGLVMLGLALDFIVSALGGDWPVVAPWLLLP